MDRRMERVSGWIMEALKAAFRGPSLSQCHPMSLQFLTKDTSDTLSLETYGNFDSQVRVGGPGQGPDPITDSLGCLTAGGACL